MKNELNPPSRYGSESSGYSLYLLASRVCLWAVLAVFVAPSAGLAQVYCTVTVGALDWGWYNTNGLRGSNGYLAGQIPGSTSAPPAQIRDFFVFNVPSFAGTLSGASLRINVDGFSSPDSSEVFQLRDVTTPVSTLRTATTGATAIYADLGDGAIYGSRTVLSSEVYSSVSIPLNAAFLTDATARRGGLMAMGGQITTLRPPSTDYELLFGDYADPLAYYNVQLSLTIQPSAPLITRQPQSLAGIIGSTGYFLDVAACGSSPLRYQWQLNRTNLPGATNLSYSFPTLTTNQAGNYTVIVSDSSNSTTSDIAAVTVVPLIIRQPPRSQSVVIGDSLGFYVDVESVLPVTYQWWFNGAELPGANSYFFTYPFATTNLAGDYWVVVGNSAGSVTSLVAHISVNAQAPSFSYPLQNAQAYAGQNVTIFSYANGGPPPGFQWFFNGNPLPDQTTSALRLTNVKTNDAGNYWVVARNSSGSVTSTVATLTVTALSPTVVPPASTTNFAGESPTFYTQLSGAPYPVAFVYQQGNPVPKVVIHTTTLQANYSFQLSNLNSNSAGAYFLAASNSVGVVTSSVFTVTVVYAAPHFISLPVNTSTLAGNNAGFYAAAIGGPVPTLQWQFNGTDLPGQTNSTLNLYYVTTNQGGQYTVVASNSLGSTSAVATLTVNLQAPYFVRFPTNTTVLAGATAAFLPLAGGAPPPNYQWQFNGSDLPGQTNSYIYLNNVATNQSGLYKVIASNVLGSTSAVATLTVNVQPPSFSYLPANTTVLAGGAAYFYAAAIGGPTPTLQWSFNGSDLAGQTNFTLSLLNVTTNQGGTYTVVASNSLGTASASATLTVTVQAPIFSGQPQSVTAVAGSTVDFFAVASAGPPPTYDLQLNGTNTAFLASDYVFAGNTYTHFSILDVTASDAGNYSILASNTFGSATSQVATLTVTPAGPLDRWHRRNPLPQGNELFGVTYGPGQFLAVGDTGAILSSPDGTNWTVQGLRTAAFLNGVTYAAGLFVAVGDLGAILTSADGVSWTPRHYGASTSLSSVAYGNGRFVAVGSVVTTSTNGTTWETPAAFASGFNCITFGNGFFVAMTASGQIWASPDGITWTQKNAGNVGDLAAVVFGGGQFVAVGGNGAIFTSPNADVWTPRTSGVTKRLRGITYGNSTFVAVGGKGSIVRSSDGVNWAAEVSGTPDRLDAVAFGNGLFVALGENGTIVTSTGSGWANETFGTRRDFDGLTSGNNLVIAVGKFGTILTSTDGATYHEQNSGTTDDLHGVGFGAGLFVAVGDPGVILTSSNAIDWTKQISGTSNYLKRVKYCNGLWVAVGDVILTSTNGTDWTNAGVSAPFEDVAFGNGQFVAVVDDTSGNYIDGYLYNSLDGAVWHRSYSSDKGLRSVIYTNGLFIVTGNDGVILVSADGLTWDVRLTGLAYYSGYNLRDVYYANGLWTIVGNFGLILTSPDTVTWKPRVSHTLENLHGVRFLNDTLVAIGNRGTILQSDSLISRLAAERAGSNLRLTFSSPTEGLWRLQESTDFNWNDLTYLNNIFGVVEQLIPLPPQPGQRFYRVVSP